MSADRPIDYASPAAHRAGYVKPEPDTSWPNPLTEHSTGVEFRLCYGTPSREDLLRAASEMAAYRELVARGRGRLSRACRAAAKAGGGR
jgi:hypothetical protein